MIVQNYSLMSLLHLLLIRLTDLPIAVPEYIETPEDSSLYIPLQGIDIDSDSLVFEIVEFPNMVLLEMYFDRCI